MNLRTVVFLLVLSAAAHATVLDSVIVQFVTKTLIDFLDIATFSTAEVAAGFRTGSLQAGNETREALYRKILGMHPATEMVYIGLVDGQFMGYHKGSNATYTYAYLPHENSSCVADGISELCRTDFSTDTAGKPVAPISSRGDFDPRTRPWYTEAVAEGATYTHDPYTFATTGRRGITYAQPLYSSGGTFLGVVGVDYDLSALDSLLAELVEGEERLIYAVDEDLEYLVASSIPGAATALVDGNWTQVKPGESTELGIVSSWTDITLVSGDLHSHDHVILREHSALRSFEVYYGEFELIFVLVREADEIIDYIKAGTFKYSFLISLGALGLCITMFLAVVVIRYRNTAIWRMAQPELLLVLLLGNAFGYAFVISNVGDHSRLTCESRNWLLYLALSITLLTIHAKVDRVRRLAAASAKLATASEPASKAISRIAPFIGFMVMWLALWTAVDGVRPMTVFTEEEEGYRAVSCRCSDDSALYFFVPAVFYNGVFVISGIIVAFQTRHLCEDVAESRAINFIFNNFNIVAMIWFGGQYIPGTTFTDRTAILTLRSILFFWATITTQIAIFLPRVYRHISRGDFTSSEVTNKLKQGQRRHSLSGPTLCSQCKLHMDSNHGSVTIVPSNPSTPVEPIRGLTPTVPVRGVPVAPLCVEISMV